MSKTLRIVVVGLLVVAVLIGAALPVVKSQDRVEIVWFIGVGTGGAPEQLEMQENVVAAFNESQDAIELKIVVSENNVAVETLSTLIATGEAPDIVGPAGFAGANQFRGNWLPIDDLIESTGYDLSQFPEAAVEVQRVPEGLLGLPLANFPALIYYRPAMFEEAGLEMPPANYGDPYVLDGEEVEWNTDTLRTVAMILTVDANGNDATMEEFDPENIVQYGFINQWADPMRQNATMFGAGSVYEDNGDGTYTAVFPEHWRPAFQWWYDGIWVDHFIPNSAAVASDLLGAGNAFSSGNVAMAQSHLWYTCCLEGSDWDLAPIPSYNGTTTARIHADTFRIMKTTEHPEEAFAVLQYLTGEASLDLLSVYGGLPARPADQPAYYEILKEKFPDVQNWDVVGQSLNYTDVPHHEEWLPNNNKAEDVLNAFRSKLDSTDGLDVQAEIDQLLIDLQAVYDEFEG